MYLSGIRWGSYQEWYELYSEPGSQDELVVFFDHYLRGVENDWETKTPKVRWDALRFGDNKPVHDIVLDDFPVPNTDYQTLYLSSDGKLDAKSPSSSTSLTYDSEDRNSWVEFTHTFKEPARLIGLPKATLYMSCKAQDDFVVFVILRKKDVNGKDMMHLNFPFEASPIDSMADIDAKSQHSVNTHVGQMGILRASQRHIDESKSMHPNYPFHPHDKQEKVPPGTVVKLEIGIWALGVDFDAGESISLRVSHIGHPQDTGLSIHLDWTGACGVLMLSRLADRITQRRNLLHGRYRGQIMS